MHINPVKCIIIHYEIGVTEFATNRSELEPIRSPAEPLPNKFESPDCAQSYQGCRRQQVVCGNLCCEQNSCTRKRLLFRSRLATVERSDRNEAKTRRCNSQRRPSSAKPRRRRQTAETETVADQTPVAGTDDHVPSKTLQKMSTTPHQRQEISIGERGT